MARPKYETNTDPAGCGNDDSAVLPQRLSPSRTQDFLGCPAKFYFRSILKIPSEATEAQAKGTLAHAAFEHIFDHPRGERTPDVAVSYVAPEWERLREEKYYAPLVVGGAANEAALVAQAEELVRRYFEVENPNGFDPYGRELKLVGDIGGVPMLGILDRLDKVTIDGREQFMISDYKGLATGTPLPTPHGWTTMGEVQVGDSVFGPDGVPTVVTVKSQVHNRDCYLVEFDDGAKIVCDNVHLWQVETPNPVPFGPWISRVVDADELFRLHHFTPLRVPAPSALELPEVVCDIDPYIVGATLASADSLGEAQKGISGAAQSLLRGSTPQRLAFLQGMMDTAGSWGPDGVTATFSHRCVDVTSVLHEAATSLGCVATLETNMVTFAPHDCCPFRTLGVAPACIEGEVAHVWRQIVSVAPVASVPTQCIAVDNDSHLYLAGEHMVPCHNTGKVPAPDDRYLADKFFGMRTYALLVKEALGEYPTRLRLVFVAGGTRGSVRREEITEPLMAAQKKLLQTAYKTMKSSAKTGQWQTKQQPLCLYCDHMSYCPGWHPHLAGLAPGDLLPEEVQVKIVVKPAV